MNRIISEIFKNKTVSEEKLSEFGFSENNGVFVYETYIQNGQMRLTVSVNASGEISANVFDCETCDEYTLFLIESATGGFVGEIRDEYAEVLSEIAEKCCFTEVFKSEAAKSFISYARSRYGDELEFLWKKFDDNAVLRRKDTGKWYGVFCKIPKNKLGIPSDEIVEIAVLRISPEKLESTIDNEQIFRGYHMNKKNWITLLLDGTLPAERLYAALDESYYLAVK